MRSLKEIGHEPIDGHNPMDHQLGNSSRNYGSFLSELTPRKLAGSGAVVLRTKGSELERFDYTVSFNRIASISWI